MDADLRELEKVSARIEHDTERRKELVRKLSAAGLSRRKVGSAARLSYTRVQQIVKGSVVALVVLGLFAVPAPAMTIQIADGHPDRPYQRWIKRMKVPTPVAAITVVEAPCPDGTATACTGPDSLIYIGPDTFNPRETLRHELGHQFDYLAMTDDLRVEFRSITGDTREWRTTPNSPHEQFAEAYSLCAQKGLRWKRRPAPQGYDWWPTKRQHRAVCRLIHRAA